jgi:hypothetical protein
VGLRVEVDELHAGGARMAQSVTAPATLASASVAPAAADQVSATVAAGLSARLQMIGAHSARAAHITTTAAGVLHANAATYREQEDANAASLRPGGATAGTVAATTAGLAAAAPPAAVPPLPASPPVGVTPSDGKAIAVLMHGGTGPGALLAAAQAARAHAAELRQISTSLRSTSDRLAVDWQSPAAQAATGRIATLAVWYDNHAQHAAAAARTCESQADSFTQARAAVPTPAVFEDLERRLEAASRANVVARGAYTPVIAALQTQLAATHTQAVTAYADYTTRAADLGGDTPTPAPPTVHALDNHTIKESPADDAGDDAGGDPPWKDRSSPRTWAEVEDALNQLDSGRNQRVRELGTPEEIREFWDWLTGNSAGHAPSNAPFPREQLDDGTITSLRPDSESGGETIGVIPPGGNERKIHLPITPPIISGPPQLPPLADHPPFAPPLSAPGGPAPTLPPWLQVPGVHGTPIPSQGPILMPNVPMPASPVPTTSTPAPGPALLPQIGHDLADAGEKIAVGGLIGVAIIGGLLGIGPGGSPAAG